MTKIIELAHALGEEIAKSDEIKNLAAAQDAFEGDAELQDTLKEYEADRLLLGKEFSKDTSEVDERVIADLKARIQELTAEISQNELYVAFSKAQQAVNAVMNEVNAEIKFCITGERPAECTHDCSTCSGCH